MGRSVKLKSDTCYLTFSYSIRKSSTFKYSIIYWHIFAPPYTTPKTQESLLLDFLLESWSVDTKIFQVLQVECEIKLIEK